MGKKSSWLLYPTYDGRIRAVSVEPKHLKSRCTFFIEELWDEETQENRSCILRFSGVAAMEQSLNFCNGTIGADLGGFYEIFGRKQKEKLLERNFRRRRHTWLMSGDYDWDQKDANDSLNYRRDVNRLLKKKRLKKYRLYLLESVSGSYLILAKRCEMAEIRSETGVNSGTP